MSPEHRADQIEAVLAGQGQPVRVVIVDATHLLIPAAISPQTAAQIQRALGEVTVTLEGHATSVRMPDRLEDHGPETD